MMFRDEANLNTEKKFAIIEKAKEKRLAAFAKMTRLRIIKHKRQ